MKKNNVKSMFIGLLVGVLLCTLTVTAFATESKKTVKYSSATVYFYEQEVPMTQKVIIQEENGVETLYFPAEVMQYMNFEVKQHKNTNRIELTMKGATQNSSGNNDISPNPSLQGTDAQALDIMQRTGTWGYIESYLPKMTNKGIDAVVDCYNSKHQNKSEHKTASRYYN